MDFKMIFKTSRKVTVELLDGGIYFADEPYRVYLNGEIAAQSETVI